MINYYDYDTSPKKENESNGGTATNVRNPSYVRTTTKRRVERDDYTTTRTKQRQFNQDYLSTRRKFEDNYETNIDVKRIARQAKLEQSRKNARQIVAVGVGFIILFTISYRYALINSKFNEKENVWYSYLPDVSKPHNRRKIKRKRKHDLEDMILEYYTSCKDDVDEQSKASLSLESLFYEFMKYKVNEVNSGTVKRMMADWNRFYKPDKGFISIALNNLTRINIDDFFNSVLVTHNLKKSANKKSRENLQKKEKNEVIEKGYNKLGHHLSAGLEEISNDAYAGD